MRPAEEFVKESKKSTGELILLLREAIKSIAYYRRLLERMEVDALTGLPSANKFREKLAEIGNRAEGVGVLFFDVNDLKFYNDTYGHKSGDLLLQKAAESIMHITNDNSITYRVGGDEFVVILENCSEAQISNMLNKWRIKLEDLNAVADGIHCSVAVGFSIGEEGEAISDVLERADSNMYDVKRKMKAGRE